MTLKDHFENKKDNGQQTHDSVKDIMTDNDYVIKTDNDIYSASDWG